MNHRELWFVGLLALAYLYVDAARPAPRPAEGVRPHRLPPLDSAAAGEPFGPALTAACPRNTSHPISLRGDGAKWCLSCDEAFYPLAI